MSNFQTTQDKFSQCELNELKRDHNEEKLNLKKLKCSRDACFRTELSFYYWKVLVQRWNALRLNSGNQRHQVWLTVSKLWSLKTLSRRNGANWGDCSKCFIKNLERARSVDRVGGANNIQIKIDAFRKKRTRQKVLRSKFYGRNERKNLFMSVNAHANF